MNLQVRSPREITAALQGYANLEVGDKYYVRTSKDNFVAWLMLQRGPYMEFFDGVTRYCVAIIECEEIVQI